MRKKKDLSLDWLEVQDSSIIKINKEIKEKISSQLEGINKQSQNYIKDILILINMEIGINKIASIILFGSQRAQTWEATSVSDCDLLIIFKDRVSNHHIKEIEKYFIALEIKHHFRNFEKKITKKILGVIQQTTGIFVSHFLTKERYWEAGTFYKIFRVNRVFSVLFAPRNIVLGNILANSSILYGDDLRAKISPKIQITFFEMIKSTIMNLMISLFSIVISFLNNLNPIKFQLESVKWALKASNYYCFRDSKTLEKISERFILFEKLKSQKKARNFYSDFLHLRKTPIDNIKFMLRCPIRIVKIHNFALLYKKLLKKQENFRIKNFKRVEQPIIPDKTFPLKF